MQCTMKCIPRGLFAAVFSFVLIAYLPLARADDGPPAEAQFGGQCVEGLAQGRHVMTNCALTWTDKDGKV